MHRPDVTHRCVSQPRTFLSVAETARLLGMSEMTVYRAIADDAFPAVRIRARLLIPARAIEEMAEAAVCTGRTVDAAAWVRPAPNGGPAAAAALGSAGTAEVALNGESRVTRSRSC